MATLGQLRKTLHDVLRSHLSSFYRDFYAGRVPVDQEFPRSWSEWESLPILTKTDLQRVPYYERLYVPEKQIYRIHQTSGTTGTGITILPRTRITYHEELLRHIRVSSYMGFMYPHSGYEMFTAPGTRFIGGDPARLEISAALAAKMRVDGIAVASASLAIEFAAALGRRYDLSRIASIFLQSDVCTKTQRAALMRLYPNAKITMQYLCAEMQGVAIFPALPAIPDEPNALESSRDTHVEIVDGSDSALQDTAQEGELIVSAVREGMALPLVRYRTGDKAAFLLRGNTRTVFTVTGRTTGDRVRLSAGQIILKELERAIEQTLPDIVDFEASVKERGGDSSLPFLSITLIGTHSRASNLKAIARQIEQRLRITAERTYAEGIERGVCAPIECQTTPLGDSPGWEKRHRLIDARER